MKTLDAGATRNLLMDYYSIAGPSAKRITEIASEHGVSVSPWAEGAVTVRRVGSRRYTVENGASGAVDGMTPKSPVKTVAPDQTGGYSCPRQPHTSLTGGLRTMAKAAAVAEEEYDTERDLSGYTDKEPTAKMVDYHEWLEGVLGVKIDMDSMFLGVTLYPDFQRSEFNKGRTAARREARAAGNGEAETETAPAAPKRGRAAKATQAASEPATPARRGRPKNSAAKGAAAPY